MIVEGAWAVWGFVTLCGLVASFMLTSAFMDRRNFDYITISSSFGGMAVSFSLIALLPVDSYSVSSDFDAGNRLYLGYYVLTFLGTFSAVVFVPFSYFYQEEDCDGATWKSKSKAAFKKSALFWMIFVLSYSFGTLLSTHEEKYQDQDDKRWIDTLFEDYFSYERSMTLALGVFATIGYIPLIYYLGFGLMALPMKFLRGKKSHKEEVDSVATELEEIRSRKGELIEKFDSETRMPRKERREYEDLTQREMNLGQRSKKLTSFSVTCKARCFKVASPFLLLIGLALGASSLLIMVSLLITTFDRLTNPVCGLPCGFLVDQPLFNPVDQLLVSTSKAFPSDYMFLSIIVLYLFCCTVYGVIHKGLRSMKLKKIEIKWKKMSPTNVLAVVIVLILSNLALFMMLYNLAPQYSTFGSQEYEENEEHFTCRLSKASDCTMTQYATIHHRVVIDIPAFSGLYLVFNFLLLITFFVSGVLLLRKAPESNIAEVDEAEEQLM
eukprot:TRINITY_DN2129_c0_g2_i4.p1 TRINITY_DN2129_c0_g2~~TRINITY_DN2129_c0_g2_i4.p1  ORF type:complete len:495 (-),score=88.36 TRINITY_DN2129_c0_g2_i4:351-1835(-)